MNLARNKIVYLALGESYVSQAIFSLLTLVDVYRGERPPAEVVVYTNASASFAGLRRFLNITAVELSDDELRRMKGDHQDILRAKIMAMRETMDVEPAKLLYIDTDTIFLRRIDSMFTEIGSGRLFLHKQEWPLRKGRKLHPELCPANLSFRLDSGTMVEVVESSIMWNSGVVGITSERKALVDDVLSLHHQFYAKHPTWHVEQFCYSLILANAGNLRDCRRYIFHYWHTKRITSMYLGIVGKHSEMEQLALLRGVRRCKIRMVWTGRALYYGHRIKVMIRDFPGVYPVFVAVKRLFKDGRSPLNARED